jgi:hypothetical protein
MMSRARLLTLLLIVGLLPGCKPLKNAFNEAFNMGTLHGMATCVELLPADVLSDDAGKTACTEKFEEAIESIELDGKAGINFVSGELLLYGALNNHSSDLVVSKVSVTVTVYDSYGAATALTGQTRVWVEPGKGADISVVLSTQPLGKTVRMVVGCDDSTSVDKKNCFLWEIREVSGLQI